MNRLAPQYFLISAFLFLSGISAAQNAHPHVQVFMGYEPYKMSSANYSIQTGGELDTSPEKSLLVVEQKESKNAVTVGLRLGALVYAENQPFRYNVDLESSVNLFSASFASARFSLNVEPEFVSESALAAFLGLSVNGYIIWGEVGEVGGNSTNDLFLSAPDGHNYPVGSKININSNFLMGISPYFGLRFYTGEFNNIFIAGGYQLAATASKWNYTIVDSGDEEQRYDIPRNLLPRHPNPVEFDGLFFRVGFSFTP